MQATEQTTTPNTEKEWKILNQLAEITTDVENQTSYYSFQSEEGNPVFDTLLVDVKSWISQLQSLVPNTIPHDDAPVVLPNLQLLHPSVFSRNLQRYPLKMTS